MITPTYRITEDDLAVLESEIPRLMEAASPLCNDPVHRKRWEAIKKILSDVRWNYGPYLEVEQHE